MDTLTWEDRLFEASVLLEGWYQTNKRDLPWRREVSAYRVWISEIMLQQTRTETVKPYYARFMEACPDISRLAAIGDEQLLKLWEGLGYYSRARNLKKTANICMEQYGGALPESWEALMRLPGIGSYTAGAIASIAYGAPYPAVDGNVLRVISRILADESDIAKPQTKKNMEECLGIFLREYLTYDPGVFNQALMELGACVCIPGGRPLCSGCPLQSLCLACLEKSTFRIPYKSKQKPRRKEERTVFVLADESGMVLHRRPEKGLLAGLYEPPSLQGRCGRQEALRYWSGIFSDAVTLEPLPDGKHIFTHIEWDMSAWRVCLTQKLVSYKNKIEDAGFVFLTPENVQLSAAIPSAFDTWSDFWNYEKFYCK